jgi:hypothetical protein
MFIALSFDNIYVEKNARQAFLQKFCQNGREADSALTVPKEPRSPFPPAGPEERYGNATSQSIRLASTMDVPAEAAFGLASAPDSPVRSENGRSSRLVAIQARCVCLFREPTGPPTSEAQQITLPLPGPKPEQQR